MGWTIVIVLVLLIAYAAYRWKDDAEPTPAVPDPEKTEEPTLPTMAGDADGHREPQA